MQAESLDENAPDITRVSGAACQISWAERPRPAWASALLSGAELHRPAPASDRLCCGALGCVLARTPASPGAPPLRPAPRQVAGSGRGPGPERRATGPPERPSLPPDRRT